MARSLAFTTVPATRTGMSGHGLWATVQAMLRARQTRRMLAEMDPRMLADIGASRSDAAMEAARPFWDVSSRRR